MKMTHKAKVKLAKKMLTPREFRAGVPLFQSKAWDKRNDQIFIREQAKRK